MVCSKSPPDCRLNLARPGGNRVGTCCKLQRQRAEAPRAAIMYEEEKRPRWCDLHGALDVLLVLDGQL